MISWIFCGRGVHDLKGRSHYILEQTQECVCECVLFCRDKAEGQLCLSSICVHLFLSAAFTCVSSIRADPIFSALFLKTLPGWFWDQIGTTSGRGEASLTGAGKTGRSGSKIHFNLSGQACNLALSDGSKTSPEIERLTISLLFPVKLHTVRLYWSS